MKMEDQPITEQGA